MSGEIARVLAVLIVEIGGGAALGFLLLRLGIGNVRRGFKLRHLPLLDGIDTKALKASTTSAWPVGGRWPTPFQYQDHLNDGDLRAAYARLARAKAQAMSVGSEVVLLSAFALLSFSLPADLSRFPHVHLTPISTHGYGSFLPRDAPLQYGKALWRSLLLFVVVAGALATRSIGQSMLELALKYETYAHHEVPVAPAGGHRSWLRGLLGRR